MILKVISYNIHKGFGPVNWRFTLNEIRRAIRETEADVCFLQEVMGLAPRAKRQEGLTEAQFEFLADTVWSHHSYGKNAVFPARHHGNAILSKYPIVFSENRDISTNRFERRGLLHTIIEIPHEDGAQVHLFNTHLNLLDGSRRRQLGWIMESIEERVLEPFPMILAGDFNDWTGRLTVPLTTRLQLKECFHTKNGSHAKSFPSFFPFLTLDRVYYRNLALINQEVLNSAHWRNLSDHLPLYVELKLEEK